MKSADHRATELSRPALFAGLKMSVLGGATALTEEIRTGLQEGNVSVKTAGSRRGDALASYTVPSGCDCDRGTLFDAEGVI